MSEPWQNRAACAGADPDMFSDKRREAEAACFCDRCPVTAECAALGEQVTSGFFAGKRIERPYYVASMTMPYIQVHGTKSAVDRHYRRGEKLCGACQAFNEKGIQTRYAGSRGVA